MHNRFQQKAVSAFQIDRARNSKEKNMKKKLIVGAIVTLAAVLVLNCGRKKATDPAGMLLDTAIEQLKASKDAKSAAAAIDTLVAGATALKEKSPDAFADRSKFADSDKAFIEAYTDAALAHMGNEDFGAAEKKLLPLGVLH
jgi:hypothetical protein